ncbi:type I pullulanase [Mesobacillus harenae]|uniref:type I pullulanase n=1 Tax=Mesobacillus harenae TaxID=2213203 RepID=UPI00157FF116|nr:type I pullulanase [Mesobacillus harenae]
MAEMNRQFEAYLDEMKIIVVLIPYSYHQGSSTFFYLEEDQKKVPLTIKHSIQIDHYVKYVCELEQEFNIGQLGWIIDEHGGKTDLQIGSVIRTPEFDERFFYEGNDLGLLYTQKKSFLALWAPTATEVKLKIAFPGSRIFKEVPMHRFDKGVWRLEIDKDLEYCRYAYKICINQEWRIAVDPYARSVSVNGEYGVVIDLKKTQIEKPDLPPFSHPVDAIIYETHIRDFTIHPDSGVTQKGTYTGTGETGTVSRGGHPTGLAYVKDLGITHLELLPFNDFAGVDETAPSGEYNWGYNPLHFNAPEGSYSSDPTDPYARIIELKAMIRSIHTQGIRVIMDAVYNHVYIREDSSFEKIVPGYFFRHNEHGLPSNGTGVGNDFASERRMARKFIVDSVTYWISQYHIDGIRFDLMGILDVETMNQIRQTADHINPSILIFGEGWDLNTPLPANEKATIGNQDKLPRIGQFNDWFRDTIKGSTFNLYDRGYALGNERYLEAAKQVLAGSIGIGKRKNGLFSKPGQSVNYVESHDNHTLWDKLKVCNEDYEEDTRRMQQRLSTGMVLLAQGVPFLHSGQEFFRTKSGVGNSYRSPDKVNWLDWNRRDANIDEVDYIKGLIAIRKSHGAFRLREKHLIQHHMKFLDLPFPLIGYVFSDVIHLGKWDQLAVYFNPSGTKHKARLPGKEPWNILANYIKASDKPFGTILEQDITLEPMSISIVVK